MEKGAIRGGLPVWCPGNAHRDARHLGTETARGQVGTRGMGVTSTPSGFSCTKRYSAVRPERRAYGGWHFMRPLCASQYRILAALAFVLALPSVVAAQTPGSQQIRILVGDAAAGEGDAVEFRLWLSQANSQPVTVQYATTKYCFFPLQTDCPTRSFHAESGTDFTAVSGTLTFGANETEKTVRVPTTQDSVYEHEERFRLRLSNPTNARLSNMRVTGKIIDDDKPTLSVSSASATEGNAVRFTVSLSAASIQNAIVHYDLDQGTADASDFTVQKRGVILFRTGRSSATVSVSTSDDEIDEEDETFSISLRNSWYFRLGDATATGIILDNDGEPGLPTLNVSDASATEGAAVSFTVSRSRASGQAVTVQYATSAGTAESGTDFTAASGTLTFGATETSKTVSVATTSDSGDEENETFTLTLSSPTNATLGDATATGTINDDDATPTLSVSEASATEGDAVEFTVSLSAASGQAVTVQYATSAGTAESGTDFTAVSGTLTFGANETSKTVSVATTSDSVDEDNETFTLTLSSPTNVTLVDATATGTINDDDETPTLSVSDASATEGDAVEFTVSLSAASGRGVSVSFGLAVKAGDTASSDDFDGLGGYALIAPGFTSLTVSVDTTEDTVEEEDETFTLTLSTPRNATLVDATATGTIVDDDGSSSSPRVRVSDASATEGAAVEFTVSLSAASSQQVTVQYATSAGTAESGTDFTAASGTLTFVANETSKTVSVATTSDSVDEENETFTLTLSSPTNATLGDGTATGTINDDDDASPALTASFEDMPSSHDGDNAFTFGLTFSEEPKASFSYKTLRDHAFNVTGGAVRTAGRKQQGSNRRWTITVEPNSKGTVRIELPATQECNASGAICTDDNRSLSNSLSATVAGPNPTVSVSDANATEGDAVEFTVSLSAASSQAVTVQYATSAGTAESGTDFAAASGTLTFGANETSKTVSVATTSDLVDEEDETFTLTLSSPTNATLGDATATGTINDDDGDGSPTLSVSDASATEGDAVAFTVSLSAASSQQVTVQYATSAGTAESGTDFTAASGTLTFGANETSKTVSVATTSDSVDEENETFTLTLSSPTNAALGDATAAGTINDDDGTPTLSVSDASATEGDAVEFTVSLSAASGRQVSVAFLPDVRTGDTASSDDFDDLGGHALFAPGFTSLTVRVDTTEDTVEEDDETFTLTLSSPTNATLGDATATGTIIDDDAPPLTASFEDMPASHDGENEFTFGLTFSEDVVGLSYKTLRDDAFDISGGEVRKAARRTQGSNQGWTIHIEPASHGTVTVKLPAGAVESSDGRQLENSPSATVSGPVGISVADATVEEATGAELAFVVTLSRPASGAVAVDYSTADGTALAGADYTAASGTLSFQAGDSSMTIDVAVLDDDHDEDSETLTLMLSNASNGRITDAEATGTITNHDPLPRALLARFGRTAAMHVVEQVEERIEAPRAPGFDGRFGGQDLRPGMERDATLSLFNQLGGGMSGMNPGVHRPMAGSPALGAASLGMRGLAGGAPMGDVRGLGGPTGRMAAAAGPDNGLNGSGLYQMGLGGGNVMTGSSFAMNRETRHGGILSVWSRGAQSHFSGRDGALSLGGDVRTTMFGADYAKGPLVAGLSLSHSRGLGEYVGVAGGQVASSVMGLYPWLGYKATDRVTVWGVAGYGAGGLLLAPDRGPALESGLSMSMAAAGTRGELVAGGASGFELAFKADALWVGTAIDGVDGPAGRLKATGAAVTRFRTGLEGSRDYTLAGRLLLKPSVEVGLRHDGGDAETGAGMDVGSGLVVSDGSTGLAVDVRVRMLLVHQAEGFRERGVSVSLSYNPSPSSPLGFMAQVAPSWGGQAAGGAEALWGRETMAGMAHGGVPQGNQMDAEVGYGLPVGSRFVGTPKLGWRTSEYGRDYRLGYSLGVLGREGTQFELGVDAERRESPLLGGASNGVLGRATVGW